jgi:RimJ/RimL family protein N-acetyltransferase
MHSITLETPRLILRQFREEDLDSYAVICADQETVRYIGEGKPLTRAETWQHMATMLGHWQLRGYGLWAVEERGSGAMIGRIGFWNPEGWPGFEVGWMLARSHWGRGLATEGARAALDYAFSRLRQTHVISLIRPENNRSIRVAEKLGERYEGTVEVSGIELRIYGIGREQTRTVLRSRD